MTIYTHENCMPTTRVVDAVSGHMVDRVISLDTELQEITQCQELSKGAGWVDEIPTVTRKFKSVDIDFDKLTHLPDKFTLHGLEAVQ